MNEDTLARLCHEVNRAYCASLGDDSQLPWEEAPQWQKDSAVSGVRMHLANPDATPEDSHKSWLRQKEADGWKYGPVKDPEKKEHPCCVPYSELPAEQRAKDYLFRGVIHAMHQADPNPPHATIALRLENNGINIEVTNNVTTMTEVLHFANWIGLNLDALVLLARQDWHLRNEMNRLALQQQAQELQRQALQLQAEGGEQPAIDTGKPRLVSANGGPLQ